MKLLKTIFLSLVSAIAIGLCFNIKIANQANKEMETIKNKDGCEKGQIFNRITKRCEASQSTLIENPDKPLTFNQTFITPQIVDLLPIFKYEEDKSKK